jgi:hypothetical protein
MRSSGRATFASKLRPGEPPDGQGYLRRAFARYQRLVAEADPAASAPAALLANLEIGFHEQTRLQPEICEAMDAGVATASDLKRRVLLALSPHPWVQRAVALRPVLALATAAARALQRFSRDLAREIVTESLMVLTMPGGLVLPLGRQLEAEIPDSLRAPTDADLREFVGRFEPTSASDDCGASDWSRLEQRMHYIAHLFRAFHERAELFDPPFTESQVERFTRGVIPDGTL